MCNKEECFLSEVGYWVDKDKKFFKRNIIIPSALVDVIRIKRNNRGIFKTAYSYNDENQKEAYLYGDFYLDFDSSDFEEVRNDVIKAVSFLKIVFKLDVDNDCKIYYSGNKGVHLIIPATILGVSPIKNLNEVYKSIAVAINDFIKYKTLDLRIYDNKRMFRIENSMHEVTNRYKVYLRYDELRNLPEESIIAISSSPREVPKINQNFSPDANKMYIYYLEKAQKKSLTFNNIKSNGTLNYMPPCIKEILDIGATSGKRNNTIAVLSSYYKATGEDLEKCISILKEWNLEKNSIPLSEGELIRTCRSIYSSYSNFGCTSIKDLGLCTTDKDCKFRK